MSKHRKDNIRLPVPKGQFDESSIRLATEMAEDLVPFMFGPDAAMFLRGLPPPGAKVFYRDWPKTKTARARTILYAVTKHVAKEIGDRLEVSFLSRYRDRIRAMRLTKRVMAKVCRHGDFAEIYNLAHMDGTPDLTGFERDWK